MTQHKTVHDAEVAAIADGRPQKLTNIAEENFFIFTHSAKKFYPLKPELNVYDIYDIAHAISIVNRYNGHTDFPYSVGQHSVYVSDIVHAKYNDPVLTLQALLHDATEAYMPDMPSPIKLCLPDFMEMEEKITESIMRAFDLPVTIDSRIDEVDKKLRGTEIKHLFVNLRGDNVWAEDIYGFEITPWQPAWTKKVFLERFHTLDAARWGLGAA